jgi:2',3'-cyclic-nucleotide 2'-phosphodiesterase (5'-nucleotidase family)
VSSGVRFDLGALSGGSSALVMVPLFLGALVLVRGLPALLYLPLLARRDALVAGLLQATSLPFLVATTAIGLELGLLRAGEAAAGNLIADALRACAGADVGLQQAGSILARPQPLPAGPLRAEHVVQMVPGTTSAVVLRVTGAQLLAALENSVSRVEHLDSRFAQVSGVRFAYDPERPPGARVVGATVGGRPVVPGATYTVATGHGTAYLPNGYDMLREAEVMLPAHEGPLLRRVLLDYLAQQGTVNPAAEGRIQAVTAGATARPAPGPGAGLPRTGGAPSP